MLTEIKIIFRIYVQIVGFGLFKYIFTGIFYFHKYALHLVTDEVRQ